MSNKPRNHSDIKYRQSFVAKDRSQRAQSSLSLSVVVTASWSVFDDGFVEAQSSDWFTRRRGGAEAGRCFLEFGSTDVTGNKF